MNRTILTVMAAVALAVPGIASAHGKLVAATPAADAVVVKPTKISLTFSETLIAPMSGIELTMTGMPGMANHAAMPIKGFKTVTDGKTMTVTLPRALPAGSYDLKWHIVGADQHRIDGSYSFSVK
jgi:methionine-rich copper-binding protein CopC